MVIRPYPCFLQFCFGKSYLHRSVLHPPNPSGCCYCTPTSERTFLIHFSINTLFANFGTLAEIEHVRIRPGCASLNVNISRHHHRVPDISTNSRLLHWSLIDSDCRLIISGLRQLLCEVIPAIDILKLSGMYPTAIREIPSSCSSFLLDVAFAVANGSASNSKIFPRLQDSFLVSRGLIPLRLLVAIPAESTVARRSRHYVTLVYPPKRQFIVMRTDLQLYDSRGYRLSATLLSGAACLFSTNQILLIFKLLTFKTGLCRSYIVYKHCSTILYKRGY